MYRKLAYSVCIISCIIVYVVLYSDQGLDAASNEPQSGLNTALATAGANTDINDGTNLLDNPEGYNDVSVPGVDSTIIASVKALFQPAQWGPPYIQIDGRQFIMDAQPVVRNDSVWVSESSFKLALGIGSIPGVQPSLIDGHMMLPVRGVCDALDYTLYYDPNTQRVMIETKQTAENNSYGTVLWKEGNYSGTLIRGIPDGFGTLKWDDGTVFSGQFVNGVMTGEGTLTCPEGFVYTGSFRNDLFNGYGKWTDPSGVSYEGEWLDGRQNGWGTMTYANGKIWQGEFENGYRTNGSWIN